MYHIDTVLMVFSSLCYFFSENGSKKLVLKIQIYYKINLIKQLLIEETELNDKIEKK